MEREKEREGVWCGEGEWEVPDSEREGEGEGDICPAPVGFSHRATREVLELLFHSISIEELEAGSVISSHRNEEKCMVILKMNTINRWIRHA